jgi:hypothetical protein
MQGWMDHRFRSNTVAMRELSVPVANRILFFHPHSQITDFLESRRRFLCEDKDSVANRFCGSGTPELLVCMLHFNVSAQEKKNL